MQDHVEQTRLGADAHNRRDVEGLLEVLDPAIEWSPAFPARLGNVSSVYRGHDGIREMFRDFSEVPDEINVEYSEIRDLGDRVLAIGRLRTRGKVSGASIETPFAAISDFEHGRAVRVRTYIDLDEAFEAAGRD